MTFCEAYGEDGSLNVQSEPLERCCLWTFHQAGTPSSSSSASILLQSAQSAPSTVPATTLLRVDCAAPNAYFLRSNRIARLLPRRIAILLKSRRIRSLRLSRLFRQFAADKSRKHELSCPDVFYFIGCRRSNNAVDQTVRLCRGPAG